MITDLDPSDVRELSNVIDSRMKTLLAEIAHADARAFKHELQAEYDRLERLQTKLGRSSPIYDSAGLPVL